MPPCFFLLLQYKLLVYVSQKQHVTTAKIDASFGYTVSLTLYIVIRYIHVYSVEKMLIFLQKRQDHKVHLYYNIALLHDIRKFLTRV